MEGGHRASAESVVGWPGNVLFGKQMAGDMGQPLVVIPLFPSSCATCVLPFHIKFRCQTRLQFDPKFTYRLCTTSFPLSFLTLSVFSLRRRLGFDLDLVADKPQSYSLVKVNIRLSGISGIDISSRNLDPAVAWCIPRIGRSRKISGKHHIPR